MHVRPNPDAVIPQAGQLLRLSRTASPQFISPIVVRVRRIVEEWTTYEGWVWMDVYQIGLSGDAIEQRRLFVKLDGLEFVEQPLERQQPPRRPRNTRRDQAVPAARVNPERVYATTAGRRLI